MCLQCQHYGHLNFWWFCFTTTYLSYSLFLKKKSKKERFPILAHVGGSNSAGLYPQPFTGRQSI